MDKTAARCREALFQNAHETVERGVAKKRSGAARQPRRDTRAQQCALDPTQREAAAYARHTIRLDQRVGKTGAVIVGNTEIEQVEAKPLKPDHRLARGEAEADDDRRPQLAQQLVQPLAQAALANRKD